jgi:hypothetical protein
MGLGVKEREVVILIGLALFLLESALFGIVLVLVLLLLLLLLLLL